MTCRSRSRRSLGLIAAGVALPSAEKEEAMRHLAVCAPCRAERKRWENLGGLLRGTAAEPPPDAGALRRVEARLHQALARRSGHPRSQPAWHWLVPAAAAVMMAVLFFVRGTSPPDRHIRPTVSTAPVPPPTLGAYHQAAARSDQALDALLQQHAETLLLPDNHRPNSAFFFSTDEPFFL